MICVLCGDDIVDRKGSNEVRVAIEKQGSRNVPDLEFCVLCSIPLIEAEEMIKSGQKILGMYRKRFNL